MPTRDGKVTILYKWEGRFGQVDPYEVHLLRLYIRRAGNLELEMASFLGGRFWGAPPRLTHNQQ
jgi:hypothetical protein